MEVEDSSSDRRCQESQQHHRVCHMSEAQEPSPKCAYQSRAPSREIWISIQKTDFLRAHTHARSQSFQRDRDPFWKKYKLQFWKVWRSRLILTLSKQVKFGYFLIGSPLFNLTLTVTPLSAYRQRDTYGWPGGGISHSKGIYIYPVRHKSIYPICQV